MNTDRKIYINIYINQIKENPVVSKKGNMLLTS